MILTRLGSCQGFQFHLALKPRLGGSFSTFYCSPLTGQTPAYHSCDLSRRSLGEGGRRLIQFLYSNKVKNLNNFAFCILTFDLHYIIPPLSRLAPNFTLGVVFFLPHRKEFFYLFFLLFNYLLLNYLRPNPGILSPRLVATKPWRRRKEGPIAFIK